MITFRCPSCLSRIFFENTKCEHCGAHLVFDPAIAAFSAFGHTPCQNRPLIGCNWGAIDGSTLCTPCLQNDITPPDQDQGIVQRWAKVERAKKRLCWSLIRLKLWDQVQLSSPRLRYRLLSPRAVLPEDTDHLIVGHDDGLITIEVSEADASELQNRREQMGENYRTVLGHFRHEVSHYLWDVLVRNTALLDQSRALFGDDREDYAQALKTHYDSGPPSDWQSCHISPYASCHPWEDWAETCAHVLHMADLVETDTDQLNQPLDLMAISFAEVLAHWYPLVERLNMLNRSLGLEDAYPFVVRPKVERKLSFAFDVLRSAGNLKAEPYRISYA